MTYFILCCLPTLVLNSPNTKKPNWHQGHLGVLQWFIRPDLTSGTVIKHGLEERVSFTWHKNCYCTRELLSVFAYFPPFRTLLSCPWNQQELCKRFERKQDHVLRVTSLLAGENSTGNKLTLPSDTCGSEQHCHFLTRGWLSTGNTTGKPVGPLVQVWPRCFAFWPVLWAGTGHHRWAAALQSGLLW